MKYLIELSLKYESTLLLITSLLFLLFALSYAAIKSNSYKVRYPLIVWGLIISFKNASPSDKILNQGVIYTAL